MGSSLSSRYLKEIIIINLVSLHWVGDDSISSTDITIPSSCLVKPAHRLEIGSAKISSFTGVGLLVGDMCTMYNVHCTMYMVNDIKRGNLTWCLWWEWVHGRWPIPLSLSPAASLDGSSQLHSQLSHSWGWAIIKQLWMDPNDQNYKDIYEKISYGFISILALLSSFAVNHFCIWNSYNI